MKLALTELAVLIVEDSESDAALALRELTAKGYKLRHARVENAKELKSALDQDWDIIISDFRLPQFNAITALEIVKESGKDIPFVIVSQAIGEGIAVELMRVGAADYVMKTSLKRLGPVVEREIREAQLRAISRKNALKLVESENLNRTILNSLHSQMAILDASGVILAVNSAWLKFSMENSAEPDSPAPRTGIGTNYLKICASSDDPEASAAGQGIRDVISHKLPFFELEYPCHSPTEGRWFILTVNPLESVAGGAVITHIDITQRKLAERALETSEQKFRLLAENAGDMISRHLPDGTYVYVSPAFERTLGYAAEEQIAHSAYIFVHPEDLHLVRSSHEIMIASANEIRTEYRLRKKGGDYIWVQSISRSLVDPDTAQICEIQVSTRDISKEKVAEAELKASEARYRTLTTELQVGVLIQGPGSEILLGNRRAYELLGLTESQLLGLTSIDPAWHVIHEDGKDFPGPTHPVPTAIATRQNVRGVVMGVYRPVTKDRVWLLVDASPDLNADGSVRQVICTFSDVTERITAEARLRENDVIMRQAQKAVSFGLYVTDIKSGVWQSSEMLNRIFGIDDSRHKTIQSWGEIIAPEFRQPLLDYYNDVIQTRGHFDREYEIVRPNDGERRWVWAQGDFSYDIEGNAEKLVGAIIDITDRKRAEIQIQAQQMFLHTIIESQSTGLVVVTKTGEITVANQGATEILQLQKGQVLNRHFAETEHWRQFDQNHNQIAAEDLPLSVVLAERKPVRNFEHGIELRDGTVKWLSVSASPIFEVDGSMFGAVASFVDITEQNNLKQKMVRQLERLRLQDKAINSSMSGVIIADARLPDNPVTFVNDAFTKITGYEPRDVIGKNCRFLQGPDARQSELDNLRYALKHRLPGEFTLRNYRKDGTFFHSKLQLAPVKNDEGVVTHFVGIQTDISEKFAAEKDLELARERMDLALRGAQLGLIDINFQTGITFYSERFGEIIGYTPAELMERFSSWRDFSHPEDLVAAEQTTRDHLAGLTESLEAELRFRHKEGRWIWILCRGRVVERDQSGKALRFTGTILDITERKEQIQKILELSQQMLNISEVERAEISSELHDVIGQSLVLLKLNLLKFLRENNLRSPENEKILLEPVADTLGKVRDVSRRLTPSHMQKVGLLLAVEDMLESAQAMSGIKIEANLAALEGFFPENWNIPCYRVIQESVTNALKHSGCTKITVSAVRLEKNLELVISDNGKGLGKDNDIQGIGLSLMRERIRGLRGHFFVNTSPAGLEVHALIPAQ